jgi:hypothetical protein
VTGDLALLPSQPSVSDPGPSAPRLAGAPEVGLAILAAFQSSQKPLRAARGRAARRPEPELDEGRRPPCGARSLGVELKDEREATSSAARVAAEDRGRTL